MNQTLVATEVQDLLLEQLAEQGFAIIPEFINGESVEAILQVFADFQQKGLFKHAAIGKGEDQQIAAKIRSDEIAWIDVAKSPLSLELYFKKIRSIIHFLNRNAFLGIQDSEFHFAHYQAGSFYAKHVDQFKQDQKRVLSTVLYLNQNRQADEGGALLIYPERGGQEVVQIEPNAGTFVLFESHLPHEVLPAKKSRKSITGWLCNQPLLL